MNNIDENGNPIDVDIDTVRPEYKSVISNFKNLNRGNTRFKRQQMHMTKKVDRKAERQTTLTRKKSRVLRRKQTMFFDDQNIVNEEDLLEETMMKMKGQRLRDV